MNKLLMLSATGVLATVALSPVASAATNDAITLSWDKSNYTATTDKSFFGVPVTVPGDTDTNKLYVKNDGPCNAKLTAKITEVKILDESAKDVHHNSAHNDPDGAGKLYTGSGNQGKFYDDLLLRWKADANDGVKNFTTLNADKDTLILQKNVAKGDITELDLTYDFPANSYSGNMANVKKREASFKVVFNLEGDDCDKPTITPTPSSRTSTSTVTPSISTTTPPSMTRTPHTMITPTSPSSSSSKVITPVKNDNYRIFTDNNMSGAEWFILGGASIAALGGIILFKNNHNKKRNNKK